ncbi:MAG: thioredoxin family protein [Gammaproteobacteria bacterium]
MRLKTAVAFAALVLASGLAQAAPKVGEAAPAFTLPGADGKSYSLADFKGKYVVLEWTNHDCPFVKKHYNGNMQSTQKELTGKGAVWLSVVSSAPGKQGHVDAARATELTQKRGAAPTAVLLDPSGDVGRKYEAKTTPHMYIVAPDGKLIYMGGIDSIPSSDASDIAQATPYVKVALAEAMSGKPLTNASTKPYGCSVKYQ